MQKVSPLQGNLQSQKTLFIVALLVVIADQLTKLWIRDSLVLGESRPHEGFVRLTLVHNTGIVFGFSVNQAVPLIISIALIAAVVFFSHRYALLNNRLIKISLGLFIGGSIGNLIDRLRFGYVTDFIDFRLWGSFHWPAFNLADVAIVVGFFLLLWFAIRTATSQKHG